MKKIILFLAFIPGILSAQYDDDHVKSDLKEIPADVSKGHNLVIIKTNKTAEANFTDFGKYLVQHGYTFKTKDADFLLLATEPKDPEKGYDYALNITFESFDIIIRVKQSGMSMGAAMLGDVEVIWADWEYAKASGNIMNQTFWDFYPVLKEYGYPIEFTRE